MKNPLLQKSLGLCVVLILLLIVIQLIGNKINERSLYRDEAKNRVSQSWTGTQSLSIPVLVARYQTSKLERRYDEASKQFVEEQITEKLATFIMLEAADVTVDINNDQRQVGIYSVPVYTSDVEISGQVDFTALQALAENNNFDKWLSLDLTLSLTDLRGVVSVPYLQWQAEQLPFSSGLTARYNKKGMHVSLPLSSINEQTVPLQISMSVRGSSALSVLPLARDTKVQLRSNWPHPKFVGEFLPVTNSVSDSGYQANWQLSSFSSDVEQQLEQCFLSAKCDSSGYDRIGVVHIEPVDIYTLSDRAIKYAILFIGLTLVAFVVFEFVKDLPIHPVQYAMIGMALTVFYLLLVSLSEHFVFGWAYFGAASACAGVLFIYLAAVLSSRGLAGVFATYILALYGTLYVIIQSEDSAFVFGSLLCFTALSALMIITRKVDWYQYSLPKSKIAEALVNKN